MPPRNPTALAEACTELLHDPHRRARLGAAARARALELFTAEQNVAALDVTLTSAELTVLDPLATQVVGTRY